MKKIFQRIDRKLEPTRHCAERFAAPALLLAIRLYMAQIFFTSGWLKFTNFLNHDWGSTVYLFEEVHPIPGVPAGLAAIAGTTGELGLSALLALGLCGRFAGAGLIIMTCIIQFAVPEEYGVGNAEHYMWILLLAVIMVKGAGVLSFDQALLRFIRRN